MKMPSIMEMFRAPTAAPAQQTAQQQPGNIPAPQDGTNGTQQNANIDPNGVVPKEVESPLDNFKDLWNNDPTPETKETQGPDFSKQVTDAANKTDFAKNISPDVMAKIAAGGEGAAAAFSEAMNVISRQSFAAATISADKMIEAKLKEAERKFAEQIPALLKRENLSSSLRDENPALNHPSAQPLIQAIQQQIVKKYPDASASEIKAKATEYLKSFADVASGKKESVPNTESPKDENWGKFFDM